MLELDEPEHVQELAAGRLAEGLEEAGTEVFVHRGTLVRVPTVRPHR